VSRNVIPTTLGVVALFAALPAGAIEIMSSRERDELDLERRREAAPVLRCEPMSLRASVDEGGSRTLKLSVRNAGGRQMAWRLVSAPAWVNLTPNEGTLDFEGELTVDVALSSAALAPGLQRGSILIEAEGAQGSPASIAIRLDVREVEKEREPEPEETPRRGRRGRLLPTEPEPVRERPTRPGPPADDGRAPRIGVRASAILPTSGEFRDYGVSPLLGLRYLVAAGDGVKISYELGLDLGPKEESGGFESSQYGGTFDALLSFGGDDARSRPYLVGGVAGLVELVEDAAAGESYTNYVAGLSLGGGYSLLRNRLDVRLVYQALLGSENLAGQALASVGYAF
jgi:hypothetical protein